MRPGIGRKALDTNPNGPDEELPIDSAEDTPSFGHSIEISFESSLVQTTLKTYLLNPTVYVLTVGMQDLLEWVLSGYGHCTMRR